MYHIEPGDKKTYHVIRQNNTDCLKLYLFTLLNSTARQRETVTSSYVRRMSPGLYSDWRRPTQSRLTEFWTLSLVRQLPLVHVVRHQRQRCPDKMSPDKTPPDAMLLWRLKQVVVPSTYVADTIPVLRPARVTHVTSRYQNLTSDPEK